MAWTPLAVAPPEGPKYCVELETRFGAGTNRAAHRIGLEGERAELDCLSGYADDRDPAIGDFKIDLGTFEMLGRKPNDFLPHHFCRLVDGIAGYNGAAARKSAGAPVKLIGIAGDDIDIAHLDAELIGDDLGEAGEMSLPLCADAGRHVHLAIGLHLDLGAFVWSDARTLDIAGDTNAHVPTFCAQARLFFIEKFPIADHIKRFIEDRLVIAAIVGERRKILIDDLVIVRKCIRRDQVAPPDFGTVQLQFLRGDIKQPFHDEYAVLAAGASIGRHDRLIGEDCREGAVVVRHHIRAEQRALTVDRYRQSIRIVGTGVVQECIFDAEDPAVGRERDLRIMGLSPFLGRGKEMFEPILDPFDRAIELHRRPRHHYFLGIEQHDLRSKAAADKWCDHSHLTFA